MLHNGRAWDCVCTSEADCCRWLCAVLLGNALFCRVLRYNAQLCVVLQGEMRENARNRIPAIRKTKSKKKKNFLGRKTKWEFFTVGKSVRSAYSSFPVADSITSISLLFSLLLSSIHSFNHSFFHSLSPAINIIFTHFFPITIAD